MDLSNLLVYFLKSTFIIDTNDYYHHVNSGGKLQSKRPSFTTDQSQTREIQSISQNVDLIFRSVASEAIANASIIIKR